MTGSEPSGSGRAPRARGAFEVPARVESPTDRMRARLLMFGLVGMTAAFAAVDVAFVATTPGYRPPYYGYGFLLAGYALVRAGHYRVAAYLVVAMFPSVVFTHVVSGAPADVGATLSYLALSPLVGALLLSRRHVAVLSVVNVGGILGIWARYPDAFTSTSIVGPLSLNAVAAGLALLLMHHHGELERARRSDLERSEERLRVALAAARMGTWDMDTTTRIGVLSDGAVAMLGLPEGEPIRSMADFVAAVHPDDRREVVSTIERELEGTHREVQMLHRVIDDSGRIRWLEHRGSIQRDDDGRPLRVSGTIQDVTERREVEERLRHSQKLEAVGRLAGGVAHDFNNLLTVILGNAQLLSRVERRAELDEISKAGQSAASLTKQLLAFSRQALLSPRVLDLNEALSDGVQMLGRLIGADVDVRFEPGDGLWPVRVDEGSIHQIVLNLGSNARDSMPNGGTLVVSTHNRVVGAEEAARSAPARPGDYVIVSVRDSGHGMDAETASRIFEPFFTTKELGKGTGLGLPMVLGVVEQSGGFVAVESELDGGTEVRLHFPRAELASASAAPAQPGPRGETDTAEGARPDAE